MLQRGEFEFYRGIEVRSTVEPCCLWRRIAELRVEGTGVAEASLASDPVAIEPNCCRTCIEKDIEDDICSSKWCVSKSENKEWDVDSANSQVVVHVAVVSYQVGGGPDLCGTVSRAVIEPGLRGFQFQADIQSRITGE